MTAIPGIFRSRCRRRGFSAVEIIAVATIMAILALILIPILTTQVGKSRETGVKDEMKQISTVIQLAQAQTSRYFRLEDYDNTGIYDPNEIRDPTTELPVTYWGWLTHMPAAERARLSKLWDGPCTVFHNPATIQDLYAGFPNAFTIIDASGAMRQPGGPIIAFVEGQIVPPPANLPLPPTQDERRDLYPLDPWGGPYLFFAPPTLNIPGVTNESIYSPVIYSLGPDGFPGAETNPQPIDYYPSGGKLGTADDITWRF